MAAVASDGIPGRDREGGHARPGRAGASTAPTG
jgi:hypothetical protein